MVGELRVQEIVRGGGLVCYAIMDIDCTLVVEADGCLRTCAGGTDGTYAYVLVDHLRWLRFAGLTVESVSLEDLRHYTAALGAHYPGAVRPAVAGRQAPLRTQRAEGRSSLSEAVFDLGPGRRVGRPPLLQRRHGRAGLLLRSRQ